MWRQAGLRPDDFWHQTPRHFQLIMEGDRKRMEQEADARLSQAYETGAFGGLAYHGKLKRLDQYSRKAKAQTPQEMLSVIKAIGGNSSMKITRVKLD